MKIPLVSIIIPCFNQGSLLKETLQSLDSCDHNLFETVIVDDGSTDQFTRDYLIELSNNGYFVIFQENMGLAQARNNAIKKSTGRYILPLDADNKLRPEYLTAGVDVLENDKNIFVVYGNGNYFGSKTGMLRPGQFNLQKLMLRNFIDACALIRKSVFDEVGYYDTMEFMGLEDWDLWLRIAFAGHKFHYIDQVLFDYRVSKKSMIKDLSGSIEKQNRIEQYFLQKYADKLSPADVVDDVLRRLKRKPFAFIRKIILKKYRISYYQRLIKSNRIFSSDFYD